MYGQSGLWKGVRQTPFLIAENPFFIGRVAAISGANPESQESSMTSILPIVIFLLVMFALNKVQTGRFL